MMKIIFCGGGHYVLGGYYLKRNYVNMASFLRLPVISNTSYSESKLIKSETLGQYIYIYIQS